MKLFYSPTSPFVRKVMATAIAAGLKDRIEPVPTNPWESPPALVARNPLTKVPCLITDDGAALFDSPVICEYLSSLASTPLLPTGAARWRVLKQQATADGIMDAAIIRRNEAARPQEAERTKNMDRQRTIMNNGLAALEAEPPGDTLDLGAIAVACCLGYLDLRFADERWRDSHPGLAIWFARVETLPPIAQTKPPQ